MSNSHIKLFAALIFFSYIIGGDIFKESIYLNRLKEVYFGENKILMEIVSSQKERELGLSGREEICNRCAMLFVFQEEGTYSFWMKNMHFDLDMVWINGNRVVKIEKNISHKAIPVISVAPDIVSDKVLEIKAGKSEELGIKVGDKIIF